MKKLIVRVVIIFILFLVFYVGGVLFYGMLNDWVFEVKVLLVNLGVEFIVFIEDSLLIFVIWNLGFGGLGEELEFFFDYGNMYLFKGWMVCVFKEVV